MIARLVVRVSQFCRGGHPKRLAVVSSSQLTTTLCRDASTSRLPGTYFTFTKHAYGHVLSPDACPLTAVDFSQLL